MNTPLLSLLAYAGWTLLIMLYSVTPYRLLPIMAGKGRPNQFPAGDDKGIPAYARGMRAHMNCVENLPIFAAVILTGVVSGYDGPWFGTLAALIVAARMGQSLAHISSGRSKVVIIRFGFFLAQVLATVALGGMIAAHLM